MCPCPDLQQRTFVSYQHQGGQLLAPVAPRHPIGPRGGPAADCRDPGSHPSMRGKGSLLYSAERAHMSVQNVFVLPPPPPKRFFPSPPPPGLDRPARGADGRVGVLSACPCWVCRDLVGIPCIAQQKWHAHTYVLQGRTLINVSATSAMLVS